MAAQFATAFANLFTVTNLFLMVVGVVVGIIFGCVPGLSAAMAIALFLLRKSKCEEIIKKHESRQYAECYWGEEVYRS